MGIRDLRFLATYYTCEFAFIAMAFNVVDHRVLDKILEQAGFEWLLVFRLLGRHLLETCLPDVSLKRVFY